MKLCDFTPFHSALIPDTFVCFSFIKKEKNVQSVHIKIKNAKADQHLKHLKQISFDTQLVNGFLLLGLLKTSDNSYEDQEKLASDLFNPGSHWHVLAQLPVYIKNQSQLIAV